MITVKIDNFLKDGKWERCKKRTRKEIVILTCSYSATFRLPPHMERSCVSYPLYLFYLTNVIYLLMYCLLYFPNLLYVLWNIEDVYLLLHFWFWHFQEWHFQKCLCQAFSEMITYLDHFEILFIKLALNNVLVAILGSILLHFIHAQHISLPWKAQKRRGSISSSRKH